MNPVKFVVLKDRSLPFRDDIVPDYSGWDPEDLEDELEVLEIEDEEANENLEGLDEALEEVEDAFEGEELKDLRHVSRKYAKWNNDVDKLRVNRGKRKGIYKELGW